MDGEVELVAALVLDVEEVGAEPLVTELSMTPELAEKIVELCKAEAKIVEVERAAEKAAAEAAKAALAAEAAKAAAEAAETAASGEVVAQGGEPAETLAEGGEGSTSAIVADAPDSGDAPVDEAKAEESAEASAS